MCGEQPDAWRKTECSIGSPPRVRGTDRTVLKKFIPAGITPACAGNRVSKSMLTAWKMDHPRVCGEQHPTFLTRTTVAGSPPRVRGTDDVQNVALLKDGITPACAGNSLAKSLCVDMH